LRSPSEAASRVTLAYVAPFVAFVAIMAVEKTLPLPAVWLYPLRFFTVLAVLLWFSRPYLSFRATRPAMSVAIGCAVFAIWIGPDVLFGPAYRQHWLFQNPITGTAVASVPLALQTHFWFVTVRAVSCTLLVPVIEELFWRGWLMRWILDKDFTRVPLGSYTPMAFWTVAVLFASEHGPYWEVGLATGVIYNWWMIRTRNLADCILAHAVTNGLLSLYVLKTGQWQYWL
jgi:CAAX prenyl protease-like protein